MSANCTLDPLWLSDSVGVSDGNEGSLLAPSIPADLGVVPV